MLRASLLEELRSMNVDRKRMSGIGSALASALFLGLAPVFGRAAITSGISPLLVVALRTGLAALLLLAIMAIFNRQFLYIFFVGLLGCFLAGAINGVGSILYYLALGRLPASVGQMLYSLYPVFLTLWLLLDRHTLGRLTIIRIAISSIAVIFLTVSGGTKADLIGVLMMLGASALYALHLPINQRVLYEIPAPTVTLYTLIAMSAVVIPAYGLFDHTAPGPGGAWGAVGALTLVTFFSRLTLFLGVKRLGGIQTAILGLGELLVTIVFSHLWLGEQLSITQWIGTALLAASLALVAVDRQPVEGPRSKGGWLGWLRPPDPPQVTWTLE
jgi:drug/metabolite transporter (DMT)-like permease